MTYLHGRVALLLGLLSASVSATAQPAESPSLAPPMAGFERMFGDAWQVTFESGTRQFDTWHAGPGGHSVRVTTRGSDASGAAWRALEVLYWDPGQQKVSLLGLNPYAQGVMEGAIRIEGERAEAVFDLHQPGQHRKMRRSWIFRGPDAYDSTLWEHTPAATVSPVIGRGNSSFLPGFDKPAAIPLAEWVYARSPPPSEPDATQGEQAPAIPSHFSTLAKVAGHTQASQGNWADGTAFRIQSSFEWVPYAEFIYIRSLELGNHGEATHLLDAFIYRHPGTGRLHCLALSASGGVYHGRVGVLEDGALQLAVIGYAGDRERSHVLGIALEQDGTLRYDVSEHRP